MAFVITAMVLFVPVHDLGTRVGMTTGSIFAAVFNRYRMEDPIGFDAAFGIADQVSLLIFSAILQILVLSLLAHHLWSKAGQNRARTINARVGSIVIGVHLMLIIVAFGAALT